MAATLFLIPDSLITQVIMMKEEVTRGKDN